MIPLPVWVAVGVAGLGSAVGVGLPEAGAVVAVALLDGVADAWEVDAWLVQLPVGAGLLCAAWPDVLVLALALELTEALAETVALGVALTFGLALAVPAVALPVGLPLGPALGVPVGLAVSLALPVELGGLCGGGVAFGLVDGLDDAVDRVGLAVLGFAEPEVLCWDGGEHDTADGGVIPGVPLPSTEALPEPPGPAGLADVLVEPPAMSLLTWKTVWRSGGTAASTTATANTEMAMASAGRSSASRQSAGR